MKTSAEERLFRAIVVVGVSLTSGTACGSKVLREDPDAAPRVDAAGVLADRDSAALSSEPPGPTQSLDGSTGVREGEASEVDAPAIAAGDDASSQAVPDGAPGDSAGDDACVASLNACCGGAPPPCCLAARIPYPCIK